jgi:hypothetical protein
MLGALLLYNHRGWLPTDRAQQRYLAGRGWGFGAQLAGDRGARGGPVYARLGRDRRRCGKAAVLRLLDAADAATADGFA